MQRQEQWVCVLGSDTHKEIGWCCVSRCVLWCVRPASGDSPPALSVQSWNSPHGCSVKDKVVSQLTVQIWASFDHKEFIMGIIHDAQPISSPVITSQRRGDEESGELTGLI